MNRKWDWGRGGSQEKTSELSQPRWYNVQKLGRQERSSLAKGTTRKNARAGLASGSEETDG